MRAFTWGIALAMWTFFVASGLAQEDSKMAAMERLEAKKEQIIEEEKEELKEEVKEINRRLEREEITFVEAEQQKKAAAERRALNIENRLAIIDNTMALLERNGSIASEGSETVTLALLNEGRVFNVIFPRKRYRKKDRRTTSDFVFAFGLNNVITDGESLGDSNFKVAGSRFAEIGWAWKTRVFQNSNWLRVKYGFSFQFNGLKPTDNRYFVDTGAQTELQNFDVSLDKSKFRMDNLVFPVHFEIGPSRKVEKEDGYVRYYTTNKVKFGFGGYAGFNLSARQKLKFNDGEQNVKQKLRANYNTENFIYGLSAYLGWRDTALYLKYDLNPIFKDNPVDQRNISLGLRFDME